MLLTESITQQSDEKSEKVGYKCDSCIFGEIGKDPSIKSEMVDANEFVDCTQALRSNHYTFFHEPIFFSSNY